MDFLGDSLLMFILKGSLAIIGGMIFVAVIKVASKGSKDYEKNKKK